MQFPSNQNEIAVTTKDNSIRNGLKGQKCDVKLQEKSEKGDPLGNPLGNPPLS